jgi:hypothetical protein
MLVFGLRDIRMYLSVQMGEQVPQSKFSGIGNPD